MIINGIPDHVHVLINLSRTITLAELMEQVKKSSSKWIKTKGSRYRHFYWQTGYCAFSVGYKNATIVKNYIKNQKKHHKIESYEDEVLGLLEKYEIEFNRDCIFD